MSQGQSEYTWWKEQRFTPIFTQSLLISKARHVAHYPYYHVDLNAGGGYNDEVKVQGSPLNFIAAADRNKRDYHAFFVDNDLACISRLMEQKPILQNAHRVYVHYGDNAEILPEVSAFICKREQRPHFAMGSMVIDPNGFHCGVPWYAAREFCARHPRIDVIMNLNLRSFRCERWWIDRAEPGSKWSEYPRITIAGFPRWFSREHWMITEECRVNGKTPWIQLVGRSLATKSASYHSLGYYDMRSERGQRIVEGIDGATGKTAQLSLL